MLGAEQQAQRTKLIDILKNIKSRKTEETAEAVTLLRGEEGSRGIALAPDGYVDLVLISELIFSIGDKSLFDALIGNIKQADGSQADKQMTRVFFGWNFRLGAKSPLSLAFETGSVDFIKHVLENIPKEYNVSDFYGITSEDDEAFINREVANAVIYAFKLDHEVGYRLFDKLCKGNFSRCQMVANSLLPWAAKHGHNEIADFSIEQGDWYTKDIKEEKTPLLLAIENGNYPIFSRLVREGADINKSDEQGVTPLLAAVQANHKQSKRMYQVLLARGAHVNNSKVIGLPLQLAAKQGDTKLCEKLLGEPFNANINGLEHMGKSALHYAAEAGHLETCRFLIEQGATVDATSKFTSQKTPFLLAVQSKHTDVCALLLDKGADIKATNNYSDSALHLAAKNNDLTTCKLLVARDIDTTVEDGIGRKALQVAPKGSETQALLKLCDYITKMQNRKTDYRQYGGFFTPKLGINKDAKLTAAIALRDHILNNHEDTSLLKNVPQAALTQGNLGKIYKALGSPGGFTPETAKAQQMAFRQPVADAKVSTAKAIDVSAKHVPMVPM